MSLHYFRRRHKSTRARVYGHKSIVKRMEWGPRSFVCKCLQTSQFKSAMERCTKRKKYFRFALVVLDYPTAAGYLEQSVFYSEIRFTDLPGVPFVCSLFHPISLSAPMLASLYRPACAVQVSDTFPDKRNVICSL